MTKAEQIAAKMIARKVRQGWNEEQSRRDLFDIMIDTTSNSQKVRDLVYWNFATEKMAQAYIAEAVA